MCMYIYIGITLNPVGRVRVPGHKRVVQLCECSSERFHGHPQMYFLPYAEGVLLHAFDNRSRVCG